MRSKPFFLLVMFLFGVNAVAADKLTVRIGNQTISAWRTSDLDAAKKEAAAQHKPISWIASDPKVLDGTGKISATGSRGATLHALYALHRQTVLVFEDGFAENHKVLPLVDEAVHSHNGEHNSHPALPAVVLLNPEVTEVFAVIEFEPDYVKRAHALAEGLEKAKSKMNSAPASPNK